MMVLYHSSENLDLLHTDGGNISFLNFNKSTLPKFCRALLFSSLAIMPYMFV